MKNFVTIFIIIVFGLIGAKALLHPGFYTSHDGEHQLVRQYVFDQGWRDGQIPVRVSRQLYLGYGYPLFIFTYRLPFYVGEVFRLGGLSFVDSIKAVFFVGYIASGLTMFWFARRWSTASGLLSAILYLWAPYRFSVMFVRAALGEHVALIFIPLLFGAIADIKNKYKSIALGALSLAGLFLSHIMMAQIILLMLVPWILGNWLITKKRRRFIYRLLATFILGIGLSAYYFIPAIEYRQLTQRLNPFYFADHFVSLKQLIYSPWGVGFSMRGTDGDGMSFQIGFAQWTSVILAAVFLVYKVYGSHGSYGSYKTHIIPGVLIIIFLAGIFLMTEQSVFIWERWRNYINIDIPWRFLAIVTFSSAALSGWFIYQLKTRNIRFVLIISFVFLAVYANRNHLQVNKYIDYPDSKGAGGIMRTDVPTGYHLVEAKYSEPPAALIGDAVSIISFIILMIVIKKS